MKYTIEKGCRFEYAHRLSKHPGKCKQIHGHSAVVKVRIGGIKTLNENDMTIDFGFLSEFLKKSVVDFFDHKFIVNWNENDDYIQSATIIIPCEPTAEYLAKYILTLFEKYIKKFHDELDYEYLEVDFYEGPESLVTVRKERDE